jgi:hypothetical protein
VILLDAALTPLAITPTARYWLAEIDDGHDATRALPWAALTLAARAISGEPPTSTVVPSTSKKCRG